MFLEKIQSPIVIFNIDDFGINREIFFEETKKVYHDLPWDYYDMRKMQLDFLQKNLPETLTEKLTPNMLADYYMGKIDITNFQFFLDHLSIPQLELFKRIKPWRKRSIAEFMLSYDDEWKIKRIPIKKFSQKGAKIESSDRFDYRIYPRVFSESTNEAVENNTFERLLEGVASTMRVDYEGIKKLNIVTHHTYVEATCEQAGNNSPEGIHQDGYDYIVSALVVERKNIIGGVSQIFGADKKTRLIATRLAPGQGILQPDRCTNLWHNVTPFSVLSGYKKGHRSSIGFDINIVQ
ncbi:MAG: hypothetical protein EPO11_10905 [Gammaproteobacteria bacterium]|nr:MAG: hypothetical protein EPO11_10905 [Gammaproteobacteria bacterium]